MSLTHPVDLLSGPDKCRIYYSRVVDLAVASGLLVPDPATDIGHFAFSQYYRDGKQMDLELQAALLEYAGKWPEETENRRKEQDHSSRGAVQEYLRLDNAGKVQDLIVIGASHAIWPTGTSFVLTYPWNLGGTGRPVSFRNDLSEFTKRRVLDILRRAGKLRNSDLFQGQ